jgi:hypothetical protein
MPMAGFESALTASERPQNLALDRAATGISCCRHKGQKIVSITFKTKRICRLGIQRINTGIHCSKNVTCVETEDRLRPSMKRVIDVYVSQYS